MACWRGRPRVSERLPWFSGVKLDDLVDYLTYVFVPALFVWRGLLVIDPWTNVVPSAMLLVERLRLQPHRRQDERPLLHRLPVGTGTSSCSISSFSS